MKKLLFAVVLSAVSVAQAAESASGILPRVILDSAQLDYVSFPKDQTDKLNSGWEMDGVAFVRPFNRQTAGVVRYGAVFAFPAGVSAELRFENAKGEALKAERIVGGKDQAVSGAFAQDGSLARVRLVPSAPVAPKGLLARPFRVSVGWATDMDFTCVPRGALPDGWRGERAKVVDLPYQACGGRGRDLPASDAILEIGPGGYADPCADAALLTDAFAFEFDTLITDETRLSAAGVDLRTLYRYTPDVWYHFRFEVIGDRAKVRLNGRVIAEDVKVSGCEIRNLSSAAKLLVDDVRAFALVTPADYPPAPVRPKGEEKWDVIMNVCSLWYNGHHAGWHCVDRCGGPRPVLGYYDEGLPETADWEIKYMVDHGVDVQAFCWYPETNDGAIRHPRNEYQLRDGFKNARYSDRMKYCLIWEIQNAGRPHSLEAWKKNYVPYLIEHHFKDPRYYAPDGKPMLVVFGGWNFPQETAFGSAATTKAAFDFLETELKKLGFKGLVTVSSHWSSGKDDLAACGFSARCAYNYGTEGWKIETQKERNLARAAIPGAFAIPTVSVGFNSEPWHGKRYPMMSPADLKTSLAWVRDEFMPSQKHAEPWQARAVWLSTWNEYGEGTYMMPCEDARGFGYLDAVRSVFTDAAPDPALNVKPTASQRARICHLYPQDDGMVHGRIAGSQAATNGQIVVPPRNPTGVWDRATLYQTPKSWRFPGGFDSEVTPIFLEGEPSRGQKTTVFAYYGVPKTATCEKPAPAIVLVHGGLGTAYPEWVRLWVRRGYAAICVDTCGALPIIDPVKGGWVANPSGGPRGWGCVECVNEPEREQWMYHAVAAVIRSHSFLRSLPNVDTRAIGITGVSWGGIISCIAAAADDRFAYAAPVYGCGFTFEPLGQTCYDAKSASRSNWKNVERWATLWDPIAYLPYAKCPFLWVDGTNDFTFSLDAVRRSSALCSSSQAFSTRVRMPHSHGPVSEAPAEILAFADSFARGGKDLVRVEAGVVKGDKLTVRFDAKGRTVVRAELLMTTDGGDVVWTKRNWTLETVADFDPSRGEVSVPLPEHAFAWIVNLVTDDDLIFSSPYAERREGAAPLSTAALQAEIDAVWRQGGGEVVIGPGEQAGTFASSARM